MNPHQKNKIDISTLTPEEQKVFRLYGKLPDKRDLFKNKLQVSLSWALCNVRQPAHECVQERKYFDSGDYAMSKAGKASEGGVTSIGSQHPLPENIPHLTSPGLNSPVSSANGVANGGSIPGGSSGSPVKESSFLHRETSADEPSVISPKGLQPPQDEGVPVGGQS
ncbi:MAG: hypothetical protein Q9163_002273 [Psora crenata]